MKVQPFFALAALVMAALALAGCGGGGTAQSGSNEFTILGNDNFRFEPAIVTVKAGQQVKLTFKNAGRVEHSLAILKPGTDLNHMMEEAHDEEARHAELMLEIHELAAGASASETFTAPTQPGDYTFACLVPGHAQAGMVGTLKVIP